MAGTGILVPFTIKAEMVLTVFSSILGDLDATSTLIF